MGKLQVKSSMARGHWYLDNREINSYDYILRDDAEITILDKIVQDHIITEYGNDSNNYNTRLDYNPNNLTMYDFIPRIENFNILNNRVYSKNTVTWKGLITSIDGDSFNARLFEVGSDNLKYETAQFSIVNDTTEDDRELISVGAIFYWSVGNIIRNRTQRKTSEIRFRRVLDIEPKEFDNLYDELNVNYGGIEWD